VCSTPRESVEAGEGRGGSCRRRKGFCCNTDSAQGRVGAAVRALMFDWEQDRANSQCLRRSQENPMRIGRSWC